MWPGSRSPPRPRAPSDREASQAPAGTTATHRPRRGPVTALPIYTGGRRRGPPFDTCLQGRIGMKTLGIVGGIGPESTIEYYRFILDGCRKRVPDGPAPHIIIDSIDV